MLFKERKEFTFVSKALPEDAFSVVKFSGIEAISQPYEFDITLASEDPEIDLKAVLQNPATLTIVHGDEELPFHGVLSRFEQLHEVKQHVFYRAVLVPKLWNAGLYRENQIFLDKKFPEIIEEILKQAGMSGMDYELNLTQDYPSWEYICQYSETDLDFISRWMEREGIYYFFEQTEQGAKMIVSDSLSIHKDIKGETNVPYSPPSGLIASEEEIVKEFVCRQKMLPAKVILKDYNYRNPGLEIKAEAAVDPDGRGEVCIYGEHFKDPGRGNELAKIRAEELLCREKEFHGEATAPAFCPGFTFELAGHYRSEYNRKYLIIEVVHEGSRAEDLLAGLGEKESELEEQPGYTNRFVCIPADIQFRPERKTSQSKFYGTMNAVVDAAGDGKFAELDDQGRYKVILPFDLSGRTEGKASRFIRMAQPYSGFTATDGPKQPSGMHFPLHKGAEVLLTFIDGDPDRPVISSSIPNPETVSPVTNENQAKSIIRDNYGNELIFDSTPGNEGIFIYTPTMHSGLQLADYLFLESKSDSGEITGGSKTEVHGGSKSETILGSKSEMLLGVESSFKLAAGIESFIGSNVKVRIGPEYEYANKNAIRQADNDMLYIAEGDAIIESEGKKKGKLLFSAGTKRQSVVEMGNDAVRLSIGEGALRIDSKARNKLETAMVAAVLLAGTVHSANAAAAIGNYLGLEFSKNWEEKCADILQTSFGHTSNAVIAALSALANGLALRMYFKQAKPDRIKENIEESGKKPNARIEMKKSGAINIDSSGGNGRLFIKSGRGRMILSAEDRIQMDTKTVIASKGLRTKNIVDMG
ncbi:MAG: type VI secretion system tip protein VgrG [Acidobacteria bacterium]|nr:type VI secretion system tip protein VgrG [Acidobacteriota bacterium]